MQRLDFNTGWHFSCPDGRDFDVTLPHDAMLNTPRNTEPGFTWFLLAGWRGNDYTYTKNLHITSELINKHLVLEFEGVYCMTTVTVNDRPAAEKAYGYTPFTVELDGLLREGDNTIEVTAHVPQDGHNRWYTGGGIYRPVHLLVSEDAYMQRYGVRVTTLSVAPACVRVEVMTHGGDCAEVRIAEKNGKEVVCAKAAVADGRAVVELEIPDAKLWNAEHPNLYLAEVTLYSGGKAVDTVTESFGLRVIEIDPARGLLINGEPTFLRGGCIHNDMGVIGVINNDATELHRARNIKKAGFNAIRSAHHPMSRSLMKACDEVGLYVMDEAFDYWYRMKSPNSPYNRYFMQDFKVDTAAMVQDAYNHPSVVIYSIGNEIPEAGGVKGVRVGKYTYYGDVHYPDGTTLGARPGDEQQFDPGVLTEGETTWLYSGFCPPMMPGRTGALCYRLASDMLTVEQTYPAVVPGAQTAKGTGFEGHAFFEASSIRKVGDTYYFIYSSELSHELCYAVSDSPCRGFVYGGTLVDNADLGLCDTARYFTGNNHGSIEQINGRWYVFYHRHTNSSMFCRQGMVEPIEILPDGRIPQVEITTSGPNGAPLPAVELRELPAYAACNLYMTQPPQVNAEAGQNPFPYITQDGADVMPESESKPEAYICNLTPGTVVGFKYLNFQNVTKVSVKTRGMCYYGGFDVLLTADGEPIGTVSAARGNEWTWQTTELAIPDGISAIYFRMKGYGTLSLAAAKFH